MKVTRSFGIGLAASLAASLVAAPAATRAQVPQGTQSSQGPKGWVGVVITTGIGTMTESGAMTFTDYPTIESIDPGSPAEKAGLQAGDLLISINAQDFRKNPIPMGSLLVPGRRIVFRYRRDDVERTSAMQVAVRPANAPPGYEKVVIIGPDMRSRSPRVAERERIEAMNRSVRSTVPVPPGLLMAPIPFGTGTPSIGIAGAELTQLNDGLRDVLKVKGEGVFVINVVLGTPAGESGLRSGDVIVRAANEAIQNPGELIRLMRAASDHTLMLRVLRKQKAQNLTLRW